VFETYVPHQIRRLGVSNFALPQLAQVYEAATVKPELVQNRFYKQTSFDADVRAFCADKGLTYQAFWMLMHNPEIMASELVGQGGLPRIVRACLRLGLQRGGPRRVGTCG
jgi:diketogulonate reductase-like aldo/keto reductase